MMLDKLLVKLEYIKKNHPGSGSANVTLTQYEGTEGSCNLDTVTVEGEPVVTEIVLG